MNEIYNISQDMQQSPFDPRFDENDDTPEIHECKECGEKIEPDTEKWLPKLKPAFEGHGDPYCDGCFLWLTEGIEIN